jgi:tRNA pseudouridine38-40 synthase
MRLRLDLAYDGTDFRGWARQPGLRTVQGTLETALARVLGGDPQLVVAGRTDAGVHAAGQVAHLDLTDRQQQRLSSSRAGTAEALAARINGVLGAYPDVVVHRTAVAPDGSMRGSRPSGAATSTASPIASPATTPRARAHDQREGRAGRGRDGCRRAFPHRSARFRGVLQMAGGATTIRTLLEFGWCRDDHGILVARADAFCHSMVRALVGACAAVGEGRLKIADVAAIRDGGVRTSDVKVLAARGLTLTEVGYPADDLLGSRAAQTRARRSLDAD